MLTFLYRLSLLSLLFMTTGWYANVTAAGQRQRQKQNNMIYLFIFIKIIIIIIIIIIIVVVVHVGVTLSTTAIIAYLYLHLHLHRYCYIDWSISSHHLFVRVISCHTFFLFNIHTDHDNMPILLLTFIDIVIVTVIVYWLINSLVRDSRHVSHKSSKGWWHKRK